MVPILLLNTLQASKQLYTAGFSVFLCQLLMQLQFSFFSVNDYDLAMSAYNVIGPYFHPYPDINTAYQTLKKTNE